MGPLEQQLGELARKRGCRLRWKSEPLAFARALTCTELDVFRGRDLLTTDGALFLIHGQDVDAREVIAARMLKSSGREGAQAASGGRQ